MSVYGKLHIYNDCRSNGQLANLVLETTNSQEQFTFSSRIPAHQRAAKHPHSGIQEDYKNCYFYLTYTPYYTMYDMIQKKIAIYIFLKMS